MPLYETNRPQIPSPTSNIASQKIPGQKNSPDRTRGPPSPYIAVPKFPPTELDTLSYALTTLTLDKSLGAWYTIPVHDSKYSPLSAYQATTDPDRAEATLLAWRLARAILVLRGFCQVTQPLADIEGMDPDPWRFQKRSYLGSLAEASALVPARTARAIVEAKVEFAVFPAPEARIPWIEVCQVLCLRMNIPAEAIATLEGDQDQVQDDILLLESVLIDETVTRLVDSGLTRVVPTLMDDLDLSPNEARALTAMAMNALVQARPTAEQTKALMVMRLEDYITRCRENFDATGEMRAFKMLTVVQGAAAQGEDGKSDLYKMVEAYEAKRGAPIDADYDLLEAGEEDEEEHHD